MNAPTTSANTLDAPAGRKTARIWAAADERKARITAAEQVLAKARAAVKAAEAEYAAAFSASGFTPERADAAKQALAETKAKQALAEEGLKAAKRKPARSSKSHTKSTKSRRPNITGITRWRNALRHNAVQALRDAGIKGYIELPEELELRRSWANTQLDKVEVRLDPSKDEGLMARIKDLKAKAKSEDETVAAAAKITLERIRPKPLSHGQRTRLELQRDMLVEAIFRLDELTTAQAKLERAQQQVVEAK